MVTVRSSDDLQLQAEPLPCYCSFWKGVATEMCMPGPPSPSETTDGDVTCAPWCPRAPSGVQKSATTSPEGFLQGGGAVEGSPVWAPLAPSPHHWPDRNQGPVPGEGGHGHSAALVQHCSAYPVPGSPSCPPAASQCGHRRPQLTAERQCSQHTSKPAFPPRFAPKSVPLLLHVGLFTIKLQHGHLKSNPV